MDRDFLAKAVWCLRHATSEEFYRGAVAACEEVRMQKHARELERAIEFAQHHYFEQIRAAASRIESTHMNDALNDMHQGGYEPSPGYDRCAEIMRNYTSSIEGSLTCGLSGGLYWLRGAPSDPPERKNAPFGNGGGDFVKTFLGGPDINGKTPEENYPHFKENPPPLVFQHHEPDTSRPCKTGDKVPFTGIWIAEDGKEGDRPDIVFAIEEKPMTPLWRLVKTSKEVEAEMLEQPGYTQSKHGIIYDSKGEVVYGRDQYEIGPATWFPLVESGTFTKRETDFPLRVEGGQACPCEGLWWSPAGREESRFFRQGEIMPLIKFPTWGQRFWFWLGEAQKK